MRKDWLCIALASALLTACTTDNDRQAPVTRQQPAYNGPVVEIGGAEPRYEPFNPATSQDYKVNGTSWKIVKDPSNFSQTGLATTYGEEMGSNQTATGEPFDANALTAAHPTLPLPSYVRVTNLANGRMIVVRVNDRGPYTSGRIIDLSRAAADRLNTSNNTRVRVDYINVAPDGTLSGPGTIGTTVAKQTYALPPRPNISGGMTAMGSSAAASVPASPPPQDPGMQPVASRPVDNSTLNTRDGAMGAPVRSSGFLGAAQPLQGGVLERSEPEVATPARNVPAANAAPVVAAADGNYVVQVGALSNADKAHELATRLGKRFGVQGAVDGRGNIYRVQLGRFSSRQQAAALQLRLANEAQQQSFITVAPAAM